jgi:four helix bundle protein
MARTLAELPVYPRALAFGAAVSSIVRAPALRRNFKLAAQITTAADSISANIEEGFQQGTDKAFARYLTIAKGSLAESIGHLRRACGKGYISPMALEPLVREGEELGRMLGGFIKYLYRSDFKDRGRHNNS